MSYFCVHTSLCHFSCCWVVQSSSVGSCWHNPSLSIQRVMAWEASQTCG